MSPTPRVAVAMSGGVDSSTAALLMRDLGFSVVGVTLRLWNPAEPSGDGRGKSCCSPSEVVDAARVARSLGIAHHVLDYAEDFAREVVRPFASEYLAGRTPIPCALCNQVLKFGRLVDAARSAGAEALVTGHYARIDRAIEDEPHLLRARDPRKDQSYFLFGIPRPALRSILFPIGDLTKEEVRERAARAGLPVADKPESQEICFVPDGDHARFVERVAGIEPAALRGEVLDERGTAIGVHAGIHRYTVGQHRGLGLGGGAKRYVTAIDGATRSLQVGPRAALARSTVHALRPSWLTSSPPAPGDTVEAQIRSRHRPAPAVVEEASGIGLRLRFVEAQEAITPGQAVVLYDGDRVLGGAWIERAEA